MRNLFRTKIFLKEYARIIFTDKLYFKYVIYVSALLKGESLPPEALDHPLKAQYSGYRELHISGDLLLVYKIDEETVKLARIGTHSQLFK